MKENEYNISLNFLNGPKIRVVVQRHFSPFIFLRLYNSLPLSGPFIVKEDVVHILVNFKTNLDKVANEAYEGGFFYDPRLSGFLLFSSKKVWSSLAQVGEVVGEDIKKIKSLQKSGFVRIEKVSF